MGRNEARKGRLTFVHEDRAVEPSDDDGGAGQELRSGRVLLRDAGGKEAFVMVKRFKEIYFMVSGSRR